MSLSKLSNPEFNLSSDNKRHVLVIISIGLICILFHQFEIEKALGISKMMPFVFVGFIFHSYIQPKFRELFLLFLTLLAALYLLGIMQGLILITLSLFFIGLYHLPIKLWSRISLMLLVVVALITLKVTDWIVMSSLQHTTTIFGSMFMFRMIIYVYENQVNKKIRSTSIVMRPNYFFMLPNLVLPLFPVIDYKLFVNSYFKRNYIEIYEKGLRWITRGFIHLLLYRFIYYYVVSEPANVVDISSFIYHATTSYLLILRLSGIFNVAVGILCLFGYDLPETFNRYFLASSFSDVWRRINIYWKDFILKIFYYPIYFRFRGLGQIKSTMLVTFLCFLITWALHSYQWFWIKGTFPVRSLDAIFWMAFAVLVTVNSFYQQRTVSIKKKGEKHWTVVAAGGRVMSIILVFLSMSMLWTLWDSVSLGSWLFMLKKGINTDLDSMIQLLSIFLGLLIIGVIVDYFTRANKIKGYLPPLGFIANSKLHISVLFVCVLMSTQYVQQIIPSRVNNLIADFTTEQLNSHDINVAVNGYYDELLFKNSFDNSNTNKPKDWIGFDNSSLSLPIKDIRLYNLKPDTSGFLKESEVTSNKWGMRDKEYLKEKSDNTIRIALLGGSYEFGTGVGHEYVYKNLLETELNQLTSKRVEILNFSVPTYELLSQVKQMDDKILAFSPNIILLAVHGPEHSLMMKKLSTIALDGIDTEYAEISSHIKAELASQEKDLPDFDKNTLQQLFATNISRLSLWAYQKIANTALLNKIVPVWLYIPETSAANRKHNRLNYLETYKNQSKEAGFIQFNLDRIFDSYEEELLKIRTWDGHPSEKAHKIIAKKLLEQIIANAKKLGLELHTNEVKTD